MSDGELALLSQGEEIEIKSESESEFLILAGPDINEPIARYGPFVMNTREEINQAISGLPEWHICKLRNFEANTPLTWDLARGSVLKEEE